MIEFNNFDITGLSDGAGGFLDYNGLSVTGATITTYSNCPDCTEDLVTDKTFAIEPTDANLISRTDSTYTLTSAVGGAWTAGALSDGIYAIKLELDNGGDPHTTLVLCMIVDTDLKCSIAKYLEDNITETELISMHTALNYAIECDRCCIACNLLNFINNKLNGCTGC